MMAADRAHRFALSSDLLHRRLRPQLVARYERRMDNIQYRLLDNHNEIGIKTPFLTIEAAYATGSL